MRVIKARRGSDRANRRLAEAMANHADDHESPPEPARPSRTLSATDHD